jgi:hypothetical protein
VPETIDRTQLEELRRSAVQFSYFAEHVLPLLVRAGTRLVNPDVEKLACVPQQSVNSEFAGTLLA